MECIYNPNFTESSDTLIIKDEEFYHIKALRLYSNDKILVSNGKGLIAKCIILEIQKKQCSIKILNIEKNRGEAKRKVILALGILDNKDRFEFALEKAIELGVSAFIPINSTFSQKKRINNNRLHGKAIAAMKQTKRATLPKIHDIMSLNEIIDSFSNSYQFILADENGSKPYQINYTDNILLLVGPEGGFSNEEKELINTIQHDRLYLGSSRLRAETAAIIGTGFAILL